FSSRRRHTRFSRDWSSDVCSSDLYGQVGKDEVRHVDLVAPTGRDEAAAGVQGAEAGIRGGGIEVAAGPAAGVEAELTDDGGDLEDRKSVVEGMSVEGKVGI